MTDFAVEMSPGASYKFSINWRVASDPWLTPAEDIATVEYLTDRYITAETVDLGDTVEFRLTLSEYANLGRESLVGVKIVTDANPPNTDTRWISVMPTRRPVTMEDEA